MRVTKRLLAFLCPRPVPIASMLAVSVAAVEVFIDSVTWNELNASIVYTPPLVARRSGAESPAPVGLGIVLGMHNLCPILRADRARRFFPA
jgi:hypothetical protein